MTTLPTPLASAASGCCSYTSSRSEHSLPGPRPPSTASISGSGWLPPDLIAIETGLKQRGKSGIAIFDAFPWEDVRFSVKLDTVNVLMPPTPREHRRKICAPIARCLRVSVKPAADPHPVRGDEWVAAIQDVTPAILDKFDVAFGAVGIDWRSLKIVRLDVAYDARLADHSEECVDDEKRERLTRALIRHLDISVSGALYSGPRWMNDRGRTIFAWSMPKKSDALPSHSANTLDFWEVAAPSCRSTIYFEREHAPLSYMIIPKKTDKRWGMRAKVLPNHQRCVRIEARLRDQELAQRGFTTLNDISDPKRLLRLSNLFPFAAPVISNPADKVTPIGAALEKPRIEAFARWGMWGYRDFWHYRSRSQRKRIKTKSSGRRRTEASLQPRSVAHAELNRRRRKVFERLAAQFARRRSVPGFRPLSSGKSLEKLDITRLPIT